MMELAPRRFQTNAHQNGVDTVCLHHFGERRDSLLGVITRRRDSRLGVMTPRRDSLLGIITQRRGSLVYDGDEVSFGGKKFHFTGSR
jgi:hypothetical protein